MFDTFNCRVKILLESYLGDDIDISDINIGTWNPMLFQVPNSPKFIGELENKEQFSKPKISVLDMLIKLPNGDIKLPFDDKSIKEFINKCIKFENRINKNWESNYYVYLTIHQSSVKSKNSQRNAGAHIDGMQGINYKEKLPVCHSYVMADQLPTKFHLGEFNADGLSYKYDNWFKKLRKQIQSNKIMVAEPYGIYFMTAYNMHESPLSDRNIDSRTFIRLEFSLKKFNRIENTINSKLDPNWKRANRDISKDLL